MDENFIAKEFYFIPPASFTKDVAIYMYIDSLIYIFNLKKKKV